MKKIITVGMILVLIFTTGVIVFAEEVNQPHLDSEISELPESIKEKMKEMKDMTKINMDLRQQIIPKKFKKMNRWDNNII